ncbi:MAG: FKBP-type peptidyl-prolyl cis-trans isomerase [Balneolaceae bacterium]
MKKNDLFLLSLILLILPGCLDAGETAYEQQIRKDDAAIQAYLAENNIEARKQSSGVYIEVLQENEQGKQVMNDHVAGILYEMNHMSGEYEIEAHTDTLNPVRFSNSYSNQHNSLYPAGLNYEIGKMRLGEKFRFYIPSYLAFDGYSHEGLFDSFSNFMIDVDLVELTTTEEIHEKEVSIIKDYIEENDMEAEDYPHGLYYIPVEEGSGETPGANSQVEFHYTRKYLDGTVIETTAGGEPARVSLNNYQLVQGLDTGIRLMKEGGRATLIMPSKIAFGESIQVIPQKLREEWAEDGEIQPLAKPFSSVIYEIELLAIE